MKQKLLVFLFISYFSSVLLDSALVSIILSLAAFAVLLVSFKNTRSFTRLVSILLLFLSIVLIFQYNMDPNTILLGIQQNIPILVLILLAPLIAVPLRVSGYLLSIEVVLKVLKKTPHRAYGGLLLFLFTLSPVLNIGAVRLTHEIVKDIGFEKSTLGKAYVSGYLSAVVWSPYFASVATVLFMLEVSLSSYIVIGLTFGTIQICISFLLFYYKDFKINRSAEFSGFMEEDIKKDWTNVWRIFLSMVLLMGIIILMEKISSMDMVSIISFSTFTIPIIWGLLSRKLIPTMIEMRQTVKVVGNSGNEIVMFLTAGLFASIMAQTDLNDFFAKYFVAIAEVSSLLLIMAIVFTTIILTMVGIHQIIVVPLLILQVDPEAVGISPTVMAFVFILAWSLSVTTSPISLTNLLVSNILQTKWWVIGFKWNGPYVVTIMILGILTALVLTALSNLL